MKSTEFRSSTGFQIFPWPGRFKTPIDLSSYLLSFAVTHCGEGFAIPVRIGCLGGVGKSMPNFAYLMYANRGIA